MIPEEFIFNRYRYVPRNLVLTLGKRKETFRFADGMIIYMNLIHDYVNARMPVIQIGMEMEMDHIIKLYEAVEDARFKLDLVEEEYDKDDRVIGARLYMTKTFSIVPMRDRSVYITSDDSDSEGRINNALRDLQYFELYLVDMDAVKWFTKECDGIYESATQADMLKAAFVKRGIGARKLVTPPQRNEAIADVTIPLGTLIGNIRHMNSAYGLYDNYPIIYYDFDYLYCLSKTQPNIVFETPPDFGTVTFMLKNRLDTDHNVQGSHDDGENEIHWINLNREPWLEDDTILDTNAKMSTLMTVDSEGSVDSSTLDSSAPKARYIYAVTDLTGSQVTNETMAGPRVHVAAPNTSIRFLRPYKDYTFYLDTSYAHLGLDGNIYRLLYWALNIRRDGTGDRYINELNLTLYNPNRQK